MKLCIACIMLLTTFFSVQLENGCSTQEKTVYYFIRHAEKDLSDPNDRNPELTEEGEKRAQEWSKLFSDKNIDLVYSTDFLRTQQTAQPIAENHNLKISSYDYKSLYNLDFQKLTRGKNTVIVGHSNTTPQFINIILGKSVYNNIDEKDYGKLYVITIDGDKISHVVKNIN